MNKKHMLIMLAFCLIPLVVLGVFFIFHISTSKLVLFGMAMFCPLAHILMMKFMGHDHEKHQTSGTHIHGENQ
jgi:ABC-type transport system involved in cytochrome bd biosynthesis fused ATPase/permease subunit